jgi:hypothetical protein
VTDLRPEAEESFDVMIDNARSPEDAARLALGIDVVRSGARHNLVARVHWEKVGQTDLGVDLYLRT